MNTQASLFDDSPPATIAVLDLRAEVWWVPINDPNTGQPIPNVVGSKCGRYTIVTDPGVPVHIAFRRNVSGDRTNPPTQLGAFSTPALAREACWRHEEAQA